LPRALLLLKKVVGWDWKVFSKTKRGSFKILEDPKADWYNEATRDHQDPERSIRKLAKEAN
jgi:hypothetical protein